MKAQFISVALILLTACKGPGLADREPWFTTNPVLHEKTEALEARVEDKFIRNSGLYLYELATPETPENLARSHDLADQPAWHGMLMAAYALKEAVTKEDQDAVLSNLADGLLLHYDIIGQKGIFGRAVIPKDVYDGPRLPWMKTKEIRPTRYWRQGTQGRWWRTGLAKNHLNLAILGAGLPLWLEKNNEIELSKDIRDRLRGILLPAVQRLVDNDYCIVDADGETTEFGALGPQIANGFNMLLVLHMMKSVSGIREGDCTPEEWALVQRILDRYEEEAPSWAPRIGSSLELLGTIVADIIGRKRGDFNKPSFSDITAMGAAYFSLELKEDRREIMKGVHKGMRGLWEFAQYERTPLVALPLVAFIDTGEKGRIAEIIQDLQDYPLNKYAADTGKVDTDEIQPLANRPMNTVYWKSSPYRKIAHPPSPMTSIPVLFGDCDYLIAYWMGRYLDLLSGEM